MEKPVESITLIRPKKRLGDYRLHITNYRNNIFENIVFTAYFNDPLYIYI